MSCLSRNSGISLANKKLVKRLPQSPETIAAIATAPGIGGIGVVRVSAQNLTEISIAILGRTLVPRHATYSTFIDNQGLILDRGIAIYFPGPNSYTGEDVLELQA